VDTVADGTGAMIESLSAVTLGTHDMAAAVRFYLGLGFKLLYGGEQADFSTFQAGSSYLNLIPATAEQQWGWWGRVVIYVSDVDAIYERCLALGLYPHAPPQDAPWRERYFHITGPDGHELSFARPLPRR
jgi:catechol 2,3-dioxygenase-like lactoylglutathione lyase family enzyme